MSLTISIIKTVILAFSLPGSRCIYQQVSIPCEIIAEHLLGKSVLQLSPEASTFDNFLFETMVTEPLLLPIKMQEKDK